ncbi:hypothetical protein CEXT_767011 [Caerostris extrusa]|uniref:Uncharacterized protein n=1 Tax=Caerostris extrusa TaxID=172846 RepID=A0AAV4WXE4_CAEEX|nr:hypothetical protein CEXT_767011 [Caerostris extrusa]
MRTVETFCEIFVKPFVSCEIVTGVDNHLQLMQKKKRHIHFPTRNARSHFKKQIKNCSKTLRWEVLLQTPCYPDMNPFGDH